MEPGRFDSLLKDGDLDEDLVKFAQDAAFLHGVQISAPQTAAHLVTHKPFLLLPSPMPRAAYLQAVALQTHFNSLIDRVSQDSDFLETALASVVEVDDFTARLFQIHKQIQREGRSSSVVLGLNRCDFMVDRAAALKQVEMNTFAAGLGGVAGRMVQLHRDVLRFAGRPEESQRLLDNRPSVVLMGAVAKAWQLYGRDRAAVLLLAPDDEYNVCDQRILEMELLTRNISVIRRSFEDVIASGFLDEEDRLFVGSREVAVVYFRYGYSPLHYPSQQFWDVRLMLERSRAVKCPDIATHLAGTKKVQQVLSEPGALERFFPGENHVVQRLRATFTGLYPLHTGPDGDRAVAMALAAPERFVLKPQREGGGNAVFGSDVRSVLERASGRERSAFVLMEKIESTPFPNVLLSGERPPVVSACTSELGVYGAYVRDGAELVMNEVAGHLLRTKMAALPEVRTRTGGAGLDNPLLF